MIPAEARAAGELAERLRLAGSRLQPAEHPADASQISRQRPRVPAAAPLEPDDRTGKLEGDLLEGVASSEDGPGPCRQRRKGAERWHSIMIECGAPSPRIVRQALEQLGVELEGQASIAFAVQMRTFEGGRGTAEHQGAGRHQGPCAGAAIDERPGQDERDGGPRQGLLEGAILRARGADDVDDAPSVAGGDRA